MKSSEVTQSCLTLCDPIDCRLPVFSVHGIFQARILNGLPFPSPADLLTQELNLGLLHCRQMLYCLSHKESHIGVYISPNLIPCWSLWYDKVSTDSMLEHCNLHFTKWLRKKKNLPYIATPNTGENTSQTQGVNIHKTWKVLWTWWTNM